MVREAMKVVFLCLPAACSSAGVSGSDACTLSARDDGAYQLDSPDESRTVTIDSADKGESDAYCTVNELEGGGLYLDCTDSEMTMSTAMALRKQWQCSADGGTFEWTDGNGWDLSVKPFSSVFADFGNTWFTRCSDAVTYTKGQDQHWVAHEHMAWLSGTDDGVLGCGTGYTWHEFDIASETVRYSPEDAAVAGEIVQACEAMLP